MKPNTVAFTLSRVLGGIKDGETKYLCLSSNGRGLRKSKVYRGKMTNQTWQEEKKGRKKE